MATFIIHTYIYIFGSGCLEDRVVIVCFCQRRCVAVPSLVLTRLNIVFSPMFIRLHVWDAVRRLHYDPGLLGSTEAGLAARAADGDCLCVCGGGGVVLLYANLIMGIVGRQFANVSQNFTQMNTADVCSTPTAAWPRSWVDDLLISCVVEAGF